MLQTCLTYVYYDILRNISGPVIFQTINIFWVIGTRIVLNCGDKKFGEVALWMFIFFFLYLFFWGAQEPIWFYLIFLELNCQYYWLMLANSSLVHNLWTFLLKINYVSWLDSTYIWLKSYIFLDNLADRSGISKTRFLGIQILVFTNVLTYWSLSL